MNYTNYSKKRSAIVRQAKRIQSKGYQVPWGYLNVPTVAELNKLPVEQQRSIIRTIVSTKPSTVGKKSYRVEIITTKSGETKRKEIPYAKKKTRKKAAKKTSGKTRTNEKINKALKEWGEEFVKGVPESEKENARLYTEAVKSGDTADSFIEWKNKLPRELSPKDVFDEKLESLETLAPETAEWLRGMYNRYANAEGEEAFWKRLIAQEGSIPEFDFMYGPNEVSGGKVRKWANIIKGRPMSGGEAIKLAKVLEKDQG